MTVPRAPTIGISDFRFKKKLFKFHFFHFFSMAVTVLQTENQIMNSQNSHIDF